MAGFVDWAEITPSVTVLDVGGGALNWTLVPDIPDLTILNLEATGSPFREVIADATALPFRNGAFDVVFSNSVIEHVPDHEGFAAEVQRVGRRVFVQTPNRRFPIEPHVMAPFVNYLPKRWQRRVYRNLTPWGWITRPSQGDVDQFVAEINLLDKRSIERLFPGSQVTAGRSIIARGAGRS